MVLLLLMEIFEMIGVEINAMLMKSRLLECPEGKLTFHSNIYRAVKFISSYLEIEKSLLFFANEIQFFLDSAVKSCI